VRHSRDKLRAVSRKVLTAAKDRCVVLMKNRDVKAIDAFIAEHEPPLDGASTGAPAPAPARGGAKVTNLATYLPAHGCTVLTHGC
jgi:hypothetical protein